MNYLEGESVVVPNWGLGEVAGRESLNIDDSDVTMIRIEIEAERKQMWVPEGRLHAECVRAVMKPNQVDKTLALIAGGSAPEKRATWNRRQRRYDQLVASNTPQSLAEVMGELAAVRRGKRLSFTERRLFDRVREQLTAEVACSLDIPRDRAMAQLDTAIGPRAEK
ncbi:MAG: RNA polymerase-interacting CarD/CdnL/TRCF family regulator [Myxococcota bacterium]